MIRHLELLFDDAGDSRAGPPLAAEPVRFGPFFKRQHQLAPLLVCQFRPWASRLLGAQGLEPALASAFEPLAHRPVGHSQRLGNRLLGPTGLGQFPGSHPSVFAPVCWRPLFCSSLGGLLLLVHTS